MGPILRWIGKKLREAPMAFIFIVVLEMVALGAIFNHWAWAARASDVCKSEPLVARAVLLIVVVALGWLAYTLDEAINKRWPPSKK